MPSIACPSFFAAITAATATGVLTVTSTTDVYPGSNAWVFMDDGSNRARVKILAVLTTTTFQVRRYSGDNENAAPSYGFSDMSAFNTGAHVAVEAGQAVPVDPSFSKRDLRG